MQQHTSVDLEQLSKEGKNFNWDRPKSCFCCGSKVWGHGFYGRYFQGFQEKLWLKRYRCSQCKALIAMIPKGFLRYFQSSFQKICQALQERFYSYLWPPWVTRQRGGHWANKLKNYCRAIGIDPESLNLKNQILKFLQEQVDFLSKTK